MPLLAGAVVAGPIIGGLVGNVMAQKDRSAQKKAMKKALSELESLGVPPDLSKEIIVEEFQRQGVYTPELEEAIDVAESEYKQIKEDPELQKAQMMALSGLQQRAKVGLSAEDRAALNQVRQEVQRDAEAKRQQVLQQMQSRGMGGSGAELIAQLQAGQSGAELASQQSDQLMSQAQQRALEALGKSGQMAGDMQQAQFGRQSEMARALDERNRFLAENTISRQQRNVQNLNQAQMANLAEQQRISEANIAARRAEAERQAREQGAQWDRKMGLASAKSNVLTGQANVAGQQAGATAQGYAQMGAGVGTAAGALGGAKTDSVFGKWLAGSQAAPEGAREGYANGGIVGDNPIGATVGPDNTEASLREGEMVLNADQQRGLFKFLDKLAQKHK